MKLALQSCTHAAWRRAESHGAAWPNAPRGHTAPNGRVWLSSHILGTIICEIPLCNNFDRLSAFATFEMLGNAMQMFYSRFLNFFQECLFSEVHRGIQKLG